jgi:hypothetical protein
MIKIEQTNGVAIAAFVFCLIAGALLSITMHQPALVMGALLGLYLLFAIKVVQQCPLAPGPLRRSSRAGNISHYSCRGDA